VATRIWSLKGGGKEVIDYNGPFSEFLAKHAADTDIRPRR
jgi:Na+-transporting NADH:ubiquinone oxidoreductase subunit NqrF